MKRSRLKPISPSRAIKSAKATERFADGHGVYWDQVRLLMDVWQQSPIKLQMVESREVRAAYRIEQCQRCGLFCGLTDPHHIFGSKAKSDEHCLLIALCRKCHDEVQSVKAFYPELLWRKWKLDRGHTDWVRMCLLLGRKPFEKFWQPA